MTFLGVETPIHIVASESFRASKHAISTANQRRRNRRAYLGSTQPRAGSREQPPKPTRRSPPKSTPRSNRDHLTSNLLLFFSPPKACYQAELVVSVKEDPCRTSRRVQLYLLCREKVE